MTIDSSIAKTIANNLRGKLHYSEFNQKGQWKIPCTHTIKHNGCFIKITNVRLRQIVGSELEKIKPDGYTMSDLNAAIKFMEMYLLPGSDS